MTRVVMGLLYENSGCILIAKRDVTKKYGGLWEFPGGKIEKEETVEDALRREIMEEMCAPIGIQEIHAGYMFAMGGFEAEFIPVSGSIRAMDIVLNEHEEFRFVSVDELRNFDFSPPDYDAIDMIERKRGQR